LHLTITRLLLTSGILIDHSPEAKEMYQERYQPVLNP